MRAFDIHAPLPAAGLVLLLMNVATIFPLWPGNIGLLQAAVALPLVQYGVAYSTGFAYGLVLQVVEVSVGVGVGLLFLAREGLSFATLRGMPDASEFEVDEEPAAGRGGTCARWRVRLASKASSPRRRPPRLWRRACAQAGRRRWSSPSPTAARGRRRFCGSPSAVSGGEADVHDAFGRPRSASLAAAPGRHRGRRGRRRRAARPGAARPARGFQPGLRRAVAAALAEGPAALLLCLGGTATMDAGAGLLEVVGELPVPARVACDVTATLLEAPRLFGPQKGAGPAEIAELERRFAALEELVSIRHKPGSGAAGGLGAALAFLGAELVPGAALVLDTAGFDASGYDLVVTGEGRVDATTALGKAPGEVVRRSAGTRCAVFGGVVEVELPGAEMFALSGDPARARDDLVALGRDLVSDRH